MSEPAAPDRWSAIRAVAGRDLVEFIRDRRTLFVTLLMPMAMYPILALASTLGLKTALSDLDARQAALPLVLLLSGPDAEDVGARIAALAEQARSDAAARADWPAEVSVNVVSPLEAVRLLETRGGDAWIPLPAGAAAALAGRGTLPLEARLAPAAAGDARLRRHLVAVARALADDARQRRVAAAGLPASVLEPVALVFAGEEAEPPAATMEGVMPTAVAAVLVLLALLTATGGFYPAIDAIAGEKERGTIETLLIAPASAATIVTGKFLAVFAVTLATLVVNAVSIGLTVAVILRMLPAGISLGVGATGAAVCAAVTLVAFVGLAAVAAAACLAVTSAARSTKEAQNTLTPVILLASGLAGSALVPGVSGPLVALVPFAGQVAVARAALGGEGGWPVGWLLALSLVSAAGFTWILLRAAAAALADEELLFRGPDSAGSLVARPAPRDRPTPMQGFAVTLVALAALWYAQGIAPADPAAALPLQQLALLLPLAGAVLWQRVERRITFGLTWPARPGGTLVAAGAVGAGLFIAGAAAMLALRSPSDSPAARDLAERLLSLLVDRPWWVGWLVVVILPAVAEEFFFRGWVLAGLAGDRPTRGRATAAVVLQAAAFAAFHLLPERMPQTFLLGLVLGWMTLATGSILPAILAHAAHNAVPLVLLARAAAGEATLFGADGSLPGWLVAAALVAILGGLAAIGRRGSLARGG